jgi:diguanylate cyclase (GGDEF)-like protein
MVCRFGGEEFLIVAFGTSKNDAMIIDTKIVDRISSIRMGDVTELTYSCGADNSKTWKDLNNMVDADIPEKELGKFLKDADNKLHEAKRSGKNQIRFVGE